MYSDVLLGKLGNFSEDLEGGRAHSYLYYWINFVDNWMSFMMGNGVGHESSVYGNTKEYIGGKVVILSDIGILGTAYLWGIFYVLCYYTLCLKLFFNKHLDFGYKAVILSFLLPTWVASPLWEINGMLLQALLIYMCDRNIVKNKNRLMKLNDALAAYNKSQDDEMNGEIEEGKTRAPMVRYQEGKSINMIWANESIGIDPNTGEEVFIALNGDKVNKWSTDNYKPLGCSDPKFEGNFGTMFMYKGFQLNAYFRYSYGADVYNQTLVDKVENVDPKENADRRVLYDRWKTPGDVAKFKAISNTEATMPTSRFIEQENYITLSSLNLSYQFDAGRLRHYGIERLKLSLIGNDVFRASTVKMERGTSYPFARNYSVALQVTF